jgi:hypothetical protein
MSHPSPCDPISPRPSTPLTVLAALGAAALAGAQLVGERRVRVGAGEEVSLDLSASFRLKDGRRSKPR